MENNVVLQFSPTLYICNTDNKEKFKIVTKFNDLVVSNYSTGSCVFTDQDSCLTLSAFNFLFVYSEFPIDISVCSDIDNVASILKTKMFTIDTVGINKACQITTTALINNKVHYLSALY